MKLKSPVDHRQIVIAVSNGQNLMRFYTKMLCSFEQRVSLSGILVIERYHHAVSMNRHIAKALFTNKILQQMHRLLRVFLLYMDLNAKIAIYEEICDLDSMLLIHMEDIIQTFREHPIQTEYLYPHLRIKGQHLFIVSPVYFVYVCLPRDQIIRKWLRPRKPHFLKSF